MMKKNVPLDFTKPLLPVWPNTKGCEYFGVQMLKQGQPVAVDDPYRHMIQLGTGKRTEYIDDYGFCLDDHGEESRIVYQTRQIEDPLPAPGTVAELSSHPEIASMRAEILEVKAAVELVLEEVMELRSELIGKRIKQDHDLPQIPS